MEVIHQNCCGLDVHKKLIVACVIISQPHGNPMKEIRRFSTMTKDLRALAEWLRNFGCTHVAMESTGVYWKPIYNILEGFFHLLVVNARDIKAFGNKKTDVHDAEWIADLLRHGLLRSSLIPTKEQRHLRDLTRIRTAMINDRSRYINRLQKLLEDANIKLTSVATDVMGVSAQLMLEALIEGEEDTERLAAFARGTLRNKIALLMDALEGEVTEHHRFCLTQLLTQIHSLDETIETMNKRIDECFRPFEELVVLLDSILGIGRRLAQIFLAEFGLMVESFPSHRHLSSWAKICPGMNESAGKRRNEKIQDGNKWLRSALLEAANAVKRSTNSYLCTQFRRIASRRGKKKASVAVAHSILVIAYHVLKDRKPFYDLGSLYFDQRDKEAVEKRLVKRLSKLGYEVVLKPLQVAA
jgi:transposase